MDRFDYSAGVASTVASGVAVGLTVAFTVGVTLPFGVALVDAVAVAEGDGDGVRCTCLFNSCAARKLTLRVFICKKYWNTAKATVQITIVTSNIFESFIIKGSSSLLNSNGSVFRFLLIGKMHLDSLSKKENQGAN